MTVALGFRDSEALRVVLASGLCPPDVLGGGARVARSADGSVVLAPDQPLPRAALARLRAFGVAVDAELPDDAGAVRCWAEAIAAQRVAVAALPSLVLLVTERAAELVELAAELVRLGCDRQELLVAGERGALRVVDPPTYTMMRALDRERGLRGFSPDPVNQEAVWVELGYRHPLADRLRAEPGTLLLIGSDRWSTLPDAGWRGLEAVLELTVPGDRATLAPATELVPRTIELRLAGGRRAAPSLWVLRQGGIAAIDKLLSYLPEDVVARLAFAATGGADPIVIVRARGGRHAPPELALPAEAYAPLSDLSDVYAPVGSIVEPPLRRERLRTILGATGGDLLWLAPLPERRFRVERIADTAFLPLADWGEYVLHASAPALVPWLRATELEFAPMVSAELAWTSAAASADDGGDERRRPPRAAWGRPASHDASPRPRSAGPERPEPVASRSSVAPVVEVTVDAELAALETAFLELDAPGDAPERLALLQRLAGAYARLGRRRDAGLCFARAVWEARPAEAAARLDAWIAADGGLAGAGALVEMLAQDDPDPDDVRVIAAAAARTPDDPRDSHPAGHSVGLEIARDPHRVQRWLDDHDGELDARTLWLSRLGLARLAGGDPLGLAHARDRILARLAGGLPVARELPAFLQFAGRTGALGNTSGEYLNRALEDLVLRIAGTRRKRSLNEAPAHLTGAYADFQLAHGFARIGKHDRARELVDRARRALADVADDPVHAYLVAAFTARIEQALDGVPAETPLPGDLGVQLASLDRFVRYKVDRLREASRILEPLRRLDPVGGYLLGHPDSRGPELAALRELAEPRARAAAVGALASAAAASDQDRERLIDGILDAVLELPEVEAVAILGRAWPLIQRVAEPQRAVLYAKALVVAGHFGRTELVSQLLDLLGAAIRVVAGPELERVLHHSVRALRRIGLRNEIAELLSRAEHALAGAGPDALRGRLALAAGLAFLGDAARALPIFEQARVALGANLLMMPRLELTRALALAYAQAPLASALGGIAELAAQLGDITDSLGTNSHYCLSVLHFVESLVLGITSDDLALGETGRRFIEDDEHLIRRRLHRDLGGTW